MQDDKDSRPPLRKLDPASLRDEFARAKESFGGFAAKTGLDRALSGLSDVVADLQEAGIDVSLEIMGGSSEQAFDLFPPNSVTVPVSGILRIGPIHRLLGIATELNKEPALVLALSEFDIRYAGPDATLSNGTISGKVRSVSYDLGKDPDALAKLERTIITYAARNAVIAEADARDAFEKNRRKPPLKLPPKAA